MRRAAPVVLVAVLLVAAPAAAEEHKECVFDVKKGISDASATISGGDGPVAQPITQPRRPAPAPLRYLRVTAGCYAWYPDAPGLDTWNIANENAMYQIILNTPRCTPDPNEPDPDRAWRIFRSFPLTQPDPTFQPGEHGITGLATYLATPNPATINHTETLPTGQVFEVRALVASLTVNWGDGSTTTNQPHLAQPYPTGGFTHTYTTKTCPPQYRISHPSGGLCHPTLDAYPITATYTWWGEYRIGGAWIPIGTLDLAATTTYDVDEVIGILTDP